LLSAQTLFKSILSTVLATTSGNLVQPSIPPNALYKGVSNRGVWGTTGTDMEIEINGREIKLTRDVWPDGMCIFEGAIDKPVHSPDFSISASGAYECSDFSEGFWSSQHIKGFGGDAYVAIFGAQLGYGSLHTGLSARGGTPIKEEHFYASPFSINGAYDGVIKSIDSCAGATFPISTTDFFIASSGTDISFTQDAFFDGECRFTGTISSRTERNLNANGDFKCSNFDEGTWSTKAFGLTSDLSALIVIEADVPSRGCNYTVKYAGIRTSNPELSAADSRQISTSAQNSPPFPDGYQRPQLTTHDVRQ
jgi:hypothetical protein